MSQSTLLSIQALIFLAIGISLAFPQVIGNDSFEKITGKYLSDAEEESEKKEVKTFLNILGFILIVFAVLELFMIVSTLYAATSKKHSMKLAR